MRVTIIGAGNLGAHLAHGLYDNGCTIHEVFSRSVKNADDLARAVNAALRTSLKEMDPGADIYLIAVSDDAISDVGQELAGVLPETAIVAHTGGGVSSHVLSRCARYGVFYPLQTFTAGREITWKEVPIIIWGNDETVIAELRALARILSDTCVMMEDEQRAALHVAAVVANNFSNHMYATAEKIAGLYGFDFALLKPLISETARKVMEISPSSAQTGPAIRHDINTIDRHLKILGENSADLRDLYKVISDSISRPDQGD